MCAVRSFHVGSGAKNPNAFAAAIAAARAVFDAGEDCGFHMTVLDLGGGFTAGDPTAAEGALGVAVPAAINAALVCVHVNTDHEATHCVLWQFCFNGVSGSKLAFCAFLNRHRA